MVDIYLLGNSLLVDGSNDRYRFGFFIIFVAAIIFMVLCISSITIVNDVNSNETTPSIMFSFYSILFVILFVFFSYYGYTIITGTRNGGEKAIDNFLNEVFNGHLPPLTYATFAWVDMKMILFIFREGFFHESIVVRFPLELMRKMMELVIKGDPHDSHIVAEEGTFSISNPAVNNLELSKDEYFVVSFLTILFRDQSEAYIKFIEGD